jgi:low temperature requirement protein LtrA
VTQLSHRLLEDLGVRGALETLLLLVVVWSAWVGPAWITNWFDPDRLPVRLRLVAVMLASLFMSVAIPDAFGQRGLMFALAYMAIQVGRTAFVLIALGGTHQLSRNFQRVLSWYVASGALWIIGGLLDGEARYVLWGLALSVDFCGPVAGFWTPSLGRTRTGEWTIEGGTSLSAVGCSSSLPWASRF